MKIGNINNGVGTVTGLSTDAQNKPVEVKKAPAPERTEVKAKFNNELSEVQEVLNEEMLSKAISQANKSLEVRERRIERAVHEVTHAVMYTIRDTKTDEVIAEFPPKKIQDMIAKMWELAGLFVDEKA